MIENVFNYSLEQKSCFKMKDSFSAISRADSVVNKIIALVKFIVLAPVNALYDSAYLLKKLLRRDVKKVSAMGKLFNEVKLAKLKISKGFDIKHPSTIMKAALAATAMLGLFYSYTKILQLFGSSDQKWQNKALNLLLTTVPIVSIFVVGNSSLKRFELYKLTVSDKYKEITRVKDESAKSNYSAIESISSLEINHQNLIININEAIEKIDSLLKLETNSLIKNKLEKDKVFLDIQRITLETSFKTRKYEIREAAPSLENSKFSFLIERDAYLKHEFETLYRENSTVENFGKRCCRIIRLIDNDLLDVFNLQKIYPSREELRSLSKKLRMHRSKFQSELNRAESFLRETGSLPTHSMDDNNAQILPISNLDFEIPSEEEIDRDEEESKTRESYLNDPTYLETYSH